MDDAHLLAEIVRLDRAHHRSLAGDSEEAEAIKLQPESSLETSSRIYPQAGVAGRAMATPEASEVDAMKIQPGPLATLLSACQRP
jgi:hypothetical protein